MIHKTQQFFRQLVDGFSQPGTIFSLNIKEEESELKIDTMLMQTLFDTDTSFFTVDSKKNQEIEQRYRSKYNSIDTADYIIFKLEEIETLKKDLMHSKKGTLLNPQESSTWLVMVDSLQNGDVVFSCEGPGIKHETKMTATAAHTVLFDIRKKINLEYPLGIDIILIDKNNQFCCIPRTTCLKEMTI